MMHWLVLSCLVVYFGSGNVFGTEAENASDCTINDKFIKEGEFYRSDRLRYQCKDKVLIPLGCYDDNDKDIEPGQDFFDNDNFKYNCYEKGLIVGYSYIPAMENEKSQKLTTTLLKNSGDKTSNTECYKDGKTFKDKELYRNKHLRFQCSKGYMQVLGCYDDSGKDVNPGNEFFDSNKLRFHCYKKGTTIGYTYLPSISATNRTVKAAPVSRTKSWSNESTKKEQSVFSTSKSSKTCLHHTGEYKDGEEYRKDFLRWKCIEGVMQILGCYDHNNKDIEVGQNFEDEQKNLFRCYKKDRRIGYYWVPKEKEFSKNLP